MSRTPLRWWWISQDVQVQRCTTCPVLLTAVNHQQLHQKLFSEAPMFFQRSLLDYTHLHHTVHWWKNAGVICLLNFTISHVLLCESFILEAVTALPQGQDHWLEKSFVLVTTSEERKEDEMEGATLYASKADSLPEARGTSSSCEEKKLSTTAQQSFQ